MTRPFSRCAPEFSKARARSPSRNAWRLFLVWLMAGLAVGCSAKSEKERREEQRRAYAAQQEAADEQQAEIDGVASREGAVELFPKELELPHRLAVQRHLAALEGRMVRTSVEVADVALTSEGILVSGKPGLFSRQSEVMIWFRLRGVSERTINGFSGSWDEVVCLGSAAATAPDHPIIREHVLSEYDSELRFESIPLIIDMNCSHAWLKL